MAQVKQDLHLLADIARGAKLRGETERKTPGYIGMTPGTWYNRLKDPGTFTLAELRNLFRLNKTTDEEIVQIMRR